VWLAVLGLLVVGVGVVVASALWGYAWMRLGGEHVAALEADLEPLGAGVTGPEGATTVLVMLTEHRDPTLPEHPPLAAGVALVQVGGQREEVAVVVLPSELPVTSGATLGEVQIDGGLDAVVGAVSDYTGVGVDHVVAATSDALPELVDVRGPVEVCSGCRELTGGAVGVAIAQGDDAERVRTIAAVVRSLAEDVDAWHALLSPRVSKRTIDVVADRIVTDVPLRGMGLVDLAPTLTSGSQLDVATLPALRDPTDGELVVLPEQAEAIFQHLRVGTPLPTVPAEDAVDVGQVAVGVLNGAGVQGLAAAVAARLDDEGFTVVGTGNAPPFGQETTVVAYARGDQAARIAAIVLVERIGAGSIEAVDPAPSFDGDAVDVLVTAGSDLDRPDDHVGQFLHGDLCQVFDDLVSALGALFGVNAVRGFQNRLEGLGLATVARCIVA